ncbi:MAG: hypothetical protein U0414_27750 [Polyangiaceae bacterium]
MTQGIRATDLRTRSTVEPERRVSPLVTFRAERAGPFSAESSALETVEAVADITKAHIAGFVAYGMTPRAPIHVCRDNAARWLSQTRIADCGGPLPFTHQSVLLSAPQGGSHIGGLSLAVGTREGLGKGLVFALRLEESRAAKVDARALVEACSNLRADETAPPWWETTHQVGTPTCALGHSTRT